MEIRSLKNILMRHKMWIAGMEEGECADLSGESLHGENLSFLNLSFVNMRNADLSGVDLSGTDLRYTDMTGANIDGAHGIASAIDYMRDTFESTIEGYVGYLAGGNANPGDVISQNVNPNRSDPYGSGISVVPLDFARKEKGNFYKVLIRWEWLPGVVVPYNTDGPIRCERVEILEAAE